MYCSPGVSKIISMAPNSFGVYQFEDKQKNIIYIGKARSLSKRLKSYTGSNVAAKTAIMLKCATGVSWQLCQSESQALLLEARLIKQHMPRYNILLKDDKSFPEIYISTESEYPTIGIHRGKRLKKGKYWGPFADRLYVKKLVEFVQKFFKLRDCSDADFASRTRPCLRYHIKLCSAPCVNKITQAKYRKSVDDAVDFLSGNWQEIKEKMEQDMLDSAEKMNFEYAGILRDRIRAISVIGFSSENQSFGGLQDADFISLNSDHGVMCLQVKFVRNGNDNGSIFKFPVVNEEALEVGDSNLLVLLQFYQSCPVPKKIFLDNNFTADDAKVLQQAMGASVSVPKRGLHAQVIQAMDLNTKEAIARKLNETNERKNVFIDLQNVFQLKHMPQRIDVFDNSHLFGKSAVGAMIVANMEGFDKSSYRLYNFKNEYNGDDYAMMHEMLERRGKSIDKNSSKYILWLIDGGKGQLSVAKNVANKLGLDVEIMAIAKGIDRNSGKESFFHKELGEIDVPLKSKTRFYLQSLRDEAHRFGITSHRKKHVKKNMATSFDSIPSIGEGRKKLLIQHFQTFSQLKNASAKEISTVKGIGVSTANKIYSFLHSE